MIRVLVVAAWIGLGVMGVLLATQIAGWTGRPVVATLQALTPYVLALAFPIAALGVISRRWPLAGVAAVAVIALVVLSWRLLFPVAQPAARAGAEPLRVFHGNLLYYNARPDEIPAMIAGLDADVLAFTEYTPEHAAALLASSLATAFPHRIEHPEPEAGGAAIWSRFPITEIEAPGSRNQSAAALVAAPDPIVVYAVHPPSPFVSLDDWQAELEQLGQVAPASVDATLIIGDFNASYWHPDFRALLDAGWRDAHQGTGAGFSSSWPTDRRFVPPFVRLDHGLVNDGLAVREVRDVDVPGSDHRGLLVTVVAAAPTS